MNFEEALENVIGDIMDDKEVNACQSLAKLARHLVDAFMDEGFTETQAMEFAIGIITAGIEDAE